MAASLARLTVELLVQVAQTFPDTIVTKQVAVEQGATLVILIDPLPSSFPLYTAS